MYDHYILLPICVDFFFKKKYSEKSKSFGPGWDSWVKTRMKAEAPGSTGLESTCMVGGGPETAADL